MLWLAPCHHVLEFSAQLGNALVINGIVYVLVLYRPERPASCLKEQLLYVLIDCRSVAPYCPAPTFTPQAAVRVTLAAWVNPGVHPGSALPAAGNSRQQVL